MKEGPNKPLITKTFPPFETIITKRQHYIKSQCGNTMAPHRQTRTHGHTHTHHSHVHSKIHTRRLVCFKQLCPAHHRNVDRAISFCVRLPLSIDPIKLLQNWISQLHSARDMYKYRDIFGEIEVFQRKIVCAFDR